MNHPHPNPLPIQGEGVITREAWNNAVLRSPSASFLQSWEWGEMQALLKVPFWRLTFPEHDSPQALALVFRRELPLGRSWLYVPHGPIFTQTQIRDAAWEAWQSQLKELAEKQNALFVRCDPMLSTEEGAVFNRHHWVKASHDVQPRHTSIVDLRPSTEEILNSFHQKTRYNIRLAEKKGVKIRFSTDPADIDLFLQLTNDVSSRSPFRYHPDEYYRAMQQALTPSGMFELAIAEHEGDILAVHILISFGTTVTYAHGASSSTKRALMAPHLLQWASMERAKAAGATDYDLFGIAAPEAGPEHSWSGITRFKAGFNGRTVSYVGAHDLILDRTWYSAVSIMRNIRKLWR